MNYTELPYGTYVQWPGRKEGWGAEVKLGNFYLAWATHPTNNRSRWTLIEGEPDQVWFKTWLEWINWLQYNHVKGREYRAFWPILVRWDDLVARSRNGDGWMNKTYVRKDFPYGPYPLRMHDA